ncbi:receptor-type tyrosine-protein phosphatase S-like [Panulirus ornatus]|uniref:receptor-type tyrosine-protein phosphatase S-like n=1 Tax=Panulirus ornatus TaxID=150431 RepID=UPI003A882D08
MATRWLIFIMLIGRAILTFSSQLQREHHESSDATESPAGNHSHTPRSNPTVLPPIGSSGVGRSSAGRQTRNSSQQSQIPDITLLYKVSPDDYTVRAYCASGQQDGQIEASLVPSYSKKPAIKTYSQGVYVDWNPFEALSARGLVCRDAQYSDYEMTAPFTNTGVAPLVPDRLSFTVAKDEDLHLTFTKYNPGRRVMWQREPILRTNWKKAKLTNDNRLIIPADQLSGSGFYTVTPEKFSPSINVDASDLGTFSLIVQSCPRHRYGTDCSQWCPDCMNGGVCDDQTGLCVCPPRLFGHRCQTRCTAGSGNPVCSVSSDERKGYHFCLPGPYGCRCYPGYKGYMCNTECGRRRWGVDCSQRCSHCLYGTCESMDGSCLEGQFASCAGGDLGLPRLRIPPQIITVTSDSVEVAIQEWNSTFDDGQLGEGETISYVLKVLVNDREFQEMEVEPPSQKVSGLQPVTMYEVRVLTVVKKKHKLCELKVGQRERVHTTKFSTTCPAKPPLPTGIEISNRTADSLVVEWQAIPYMKECNFKYYVHVIDDNGKSKLVEDTQYLVSGLRPFSNYTFSLYTYHQLSETFSDKPDIITWGMTLPRKPGPPVVSHYTNGTNIIFEWKALPTDQGSISYRYKYERKYKACDNSTHTSSSWNHSPKNVIQLLAIPYTTVLLQVQPANEAGMGNASTDTAEVPATVPNNKIEDITCPSNYNCFVTVDGQCNLENGPGFRVGYLLRPHDDDILEYDAERSEAFVYQSDSSSSRFLISLPGDMLAYTAYRVTVYPANDEGSNRSLNKSEVFTTDPAAPGPVTNMNVFENSESLTVEWDDPDDYPPRGQLSLFKIAWIEASSQSWTTVSLSSSNKTFTIKHLTPNQEYVIRVRAKNLWVSGFGPLVSRTAKTKKARPTPPLDLNVVNVTQTEAVVQWEEPVSTYGPVNYTTSAQTVQPLASEQLASLNTTAKVIRFTGLRAAHQYTVKVVACNEEKCGEEAKISLWTKPTPPKPLSQVEKVDQTDTSITIHLPKVAIYPVWQWIIVANPPVNMTKERATEIVDGKLQKLRVADRVWVAAILFQDEGIFTNEFVVGNDQSYGDFHNHPLESGKWYQLTVVTETRAGDHRELYVSKPKTFLARHPVDHTALVSILLVLLLLVVLIVVVFLWRRSKHKPSLMRVSPQPNTYLSNDFEGVATVTDDCNDVEKTVIPDGVVELKPVQKPDHSHNHHVPVEAEEELTYVNVTRRVPRAEVETYLAQAIRSQDTIEEFKRVPASMDKSCSEGECLENRRKNRYKNNLPYNETRVKLTCLPDEPFSDYVNANYIQGHSRPDAYIASQGPKDCNEDTIGDFWRMIWESNTHVIIMLANLIENGRVKVAQYWPEESMVRDDMNITLVSTEAKMDFIIRTLKVTKDEQVRNVQHYHYTAWPDHGVPDHPFGLAQMLNIILEDYTTGPITVHCSAGIGRTGTIILVLYVLDQLNTSGYMDAHEALVTLRNGRSRLVDNTIQYVFGHQLLHEIVTGTKTCCSCVKFPQEVVRLRQPQPQSDASVIHQQFKKLKLLPKSFTYKFAQDPVCANLNRDPNILPADNKMVFLQSCGGGLQHQYVNIVRVNAMDCKDAYFAGEHPQSHTLGALWRLVYERCVPVWVLLQTFPDHDPEYPDLLDSKQPQEVGGMSLTVTDEVQFKNFVEYHVEITIPKSRVFASHKCVVLKMEGWPHTEPLPASPEPLLAVIDKAKFFATRQSCTLFTCKDGVVGCGVAVAIRQVIDRIDLLQEVDIYRSVLSVLYDRPQFITSVEQYDFLHEVALEYLKNNDHYSNFF